MTTEEKGAVAVLLLAIGLIGSVFFSGWLFLIVPVGLALLWQYAGERERNER